jgi:tetratricopeptide (TPR) repeat protein
MFFFSKENIIEFKTKSIEHAYLTLLNDEPDNAYKIFAESDSPRSNWGKTLTEIINGCIVRFPTYFEIRNFLEIDLDFLLKNKKIDYIENILGSLKILININNETYKYVARVMLENNFDDAAKKYLDKSKDVFYNDVELHFLYAKYYIKMRSYEQADQHLEECLKILPDYFPAQKLQKEISQYLA